MKVLAFEQSTLMPKASLLETVPLSSIALSTLSFFVIVSVQVVTGSFFTPISTVVDYYYPTNRTSKRFSIDLNFSHLTARNDFLTLDYSLARFSSSPNFTSLPLHIVQHITYPPDPAVKRNWRVIHKTDFFSFAPDSRFSAVIPILDHGISGNEAIQLSIGFAGDFREIAAVLFQYFHRNPMAFSYCRFCRLIMSVLIGHLALIFARQLRSLKFMTVLALLVGVTGVLASNPLALLLWRWDATHASDLVLSSLYLGVFRLFIFASLEMLWGQNVVLIALTLPFFALHAGMAGCCHFEAIAKIEGGELKFGMEPGLFWFDVIYAALIATWTALGIFLGGDHERSVAVFGVIGLVEIGACWTTRLVGKLAEIAPLVTLPSVVPMALGAIVLHLLSGDAHGAYQDLDGANAAVSTLVIREDDFGEQ
jgi:hypothetical protein